MEIPRPIRTRARCAAAVERGALAPGRPGHVGRRALAALAAVAVLVAGCVGTVAETSGGAGGPTAVATPTATPTATASGDQVQATPDTGHASARPDVVPPGLVGRPWIASLPNGKQVVGLAGSRTRLVLPDGERPYEVAGASVATVARGPGEVGSIVRVRPIRGGRPILEAARAEEVVSVAFAGDRLLVGGFDPARPGLDTGLVSIALADGAVTVLVGQTALEAPPAGDLVRSVGVSASGRTAVSGLCSMTGCAADIVDLESGQVHRIMEMGPYFPGIVTDDVLVVGPDVPDEMRVLDVATGRALWTKADAEFGRRYATSDGSLVLSYVDKSGPWTFTVSVANPTTGEERVLLRRDSAEGLTLWPELSNDEQAVVGSGGPFFEAAASGAPLDAATLDLASGTFVPDAVAVDPTP